MWVTNYSGAFRFTAICEMVVQHYDRVAVLRGGLVQNVAGRDAVVYRDDKAVFDALQNRIGYAVSVRKSAGDDGPHLDAHAIQEPRQNRGRGDAVRIIVADNHDGHILADTFLNGLPRLLNAADLLCGHFSRR